ncbi:MAG TPA: hypothetical protein VJ952_07340, partial [Opitutales bacterium]|nr:hypothetical protein [Opitutales bacterium]
MSLFAYPYEMAAHLIVSGEDAADFLQSQFSNDLRPYSVGQCTYGLWLDVRGKIVADSWILCEGGERFRIFSENCAGDAIKEKLESHIIADDVELEPGGPVPGLALVGNDSDAAAGKSDGVWLDFPGRRSLLPSREILFDDGSFRGSWLEAKACQIVSKKWIQNERMKCGIPAVGGEALPGDLPGEVGLVGDAVSLKKGCFLGQEVVARMFNVGRPQRGLYVL